MKKDDWVLSQLIVRFWNKDEDFVHRGMLNPFPRIFLRIWRLFCMVGCRTCSTFQSIAIFRQRVHEISSYVEQGFNVEFGHVTLACYFKLLYSARNRQKWLKKKKAEYYFARIDTYPIILNSKRFLNKTTRYCMWYGDDWDNLLRLFHYIYCLYCIMGVHMEIVSNQNRRLL